MEINDRFGISQTIHYQNCDHSVSMTGDFHNLIITLSIASTGGQYLAADTIALQNKWGIVFHDEGFQLPVTTRCWDMIENVNIILLSRNKIYKARTKIIIIDTHPVSEVDFMQGFPWYRFFRS